MHLGSIIYMYMYIYKIQIGPNFGSERQAGLWDSWDFKNYS